MLEGDYILDSGQRITVRPIVEEGEVLVSDDGLTRLPYPDIVIGGEIEWSDHPEEGAVHGHTLHNEDREPFRLHLPNVIDGVARPGRCDDLDIAEDYWICLHV